LIYQRRMQSASAKCFLFTAAVFLLQVFPLTGMLLMILAVPFWSVITINLGFILVIADVVAGTLPRGALALPVICRKQPSFRSRPGHVVFRIPRSSTLCRL
jgi:hypothetical protein